MMEIPTIWPLEKPWWLVASNVATTMSLLCMVSCQFLFSLRQPNGNIAGGGLSRNPLLRISILEPASNPPSAVGSGPNAPGFVLVTTTKRISGTEEAPEKRLPARRPTSKGSSSPSEIGGIAQCGQAILLPPQHLLCSAIPAADLFFISDQCRLLSKVQQLSTRRQLSLLQFTVNPVEELELTMKLRDSPSSL
ncbi:hypothetical protein NL676_039553 [Syzygium grande]|nr:hypothetical protein NL676_039553 [Syzygium grande]